MKTVRAAAILLIVLLQGCAIFLPPPKQKFYSLHVDRQSMSGSGQIILCVAPLTIDSQYENQGFTYLLPEGQIKADYYHLFLGAPEAMVTDLLKSWLRHSGQYRSVTGLSQSPVASYILSGNIVKIYGDYTNRDQPVGVVALRMFLTPGEDESSPSRKLLGRYEARIPLKQNTPDGLVQAWNTGLQQCFQQIQADLKRATH